MKALVGNKKLPLIIALGLLFLIILAGFAAAFALTRNKGTNEEENNEATTLTPTAASTETPEGTEVPTETTTPTTTTTKAPTATPTPTPNNNGAAKARNTQRKVDLTQLINGISIYLTDGNSLSSLGAIPTCPTAKTIGTASGNINLEAKLVPEYLQSIPTDPTNGSDVSTGYTICQRTDGRIEIAAPYAELGETIVVIR